MESTFEYSCPYCGEVSTSFFDMSEGSTSYIEDCQVCCRPINLRFTVDGYGGFQVASDRAY